MNPKDSVELILGIMAILGMIYALAQVERRIYDEIHKLESRLTTRFTVSETKFDVHMQDYANRKEAVDYRLGGLNEKIEHKFNRLHAEVKELQRFMQSNFPFRVRDSDE